MDWKNGKLILNLCKSQTTVVVVNVYIVEYKIRKAIRQAFSSYLINVCIEKPIRRVKKKSQEVNKFHINTLYTFCG